MIAKENKYVVILVVIIYSNIKITLKNICKEKKDKSRNISPPLSLRLGYCNFDVCWSEVVARDLSEVAVVVVGES